MRGRKAGEGDGLDIQSINVYDPFISQYRASSTHCASQSLVQTPSVLPSLRNESLGPAGWGKELQPPCGGGQGVANWPPATQRSAGLLL